MHYFLEGGTGGRWRRRKGDVATPACLPALPLPHACCLPARLPASYLLLPLPTTACLLEGGEGRGRDGGGRMPHAYAACFYLPMPAYAMHCPAYLPALLTTPLPSSATTAPFPCLLPPYHFYTYFPTSSLPFCRRKRRKTGGGRRKVVCLGWRWFSHYLSLISIRPIILIIWFMPWRQRHAATAGRQTSDEKRLADIRAATTLQRSGNSYGRPRASVVGDNFSGLPQHLFLIAVGGAAACSFNAVAAIAFWR